MSTPHIKSTRTFSYRFSYLGVVMLVMAATLVAMATPTAASPVAPFWGQLGADIDGETGDLSGYSVAMSSDGNTVIIGAPRGTDTDAGKARVYQWNTGTSTWVQIGADIDGEAADDRSGFAVAMSGDGTTVIIGAPVNDGTGPYAGHARVYEWNDITSTWLQVGGDIDGEAAGDHFGEAVAMSSDGTTVIIGAPVNDGTGPYAGHARVYEWNDATSTWVQVGGDIDGEAAWDNSGHSVAISSDGNTVIIGAPYNVSTGSMAGHARVYRWNSAASTWVQVGGDIDGEADGEFAGYSVSMSSDGNTVTIGAPFSSPSLARVYKWDDAASTWIQVGGDIVGEAAPYWFGYTVAMSSDGNTVLIGAGGDSYSGPTQAQVYQWNDTTLTWVQVGGDIDGGGPDDCCGMGTSRPQAISSDGNTVIIGTHWHNGIDSAGYARVYRLVDDSDGDGVVDRDDLCADTVIPDPTIPTRRLGTNRWALVDDDGDFDTFHPRGKAPTRTYAMVDTGGCNAEQIADALRLGKGHYKYGLSTDAMNRWVRFVTSEGAS